MDPAQTATYTPTATATSTVAPTGTPTLTPTAIDGILLADDFNRPDSLAVGNNWLEVEPPGAEVGITTGRLCFLDASDLANRPVVSHAFPQVSSGQVVWTFDFDWQRTPKEVGYRLFMQMGEGGLMSADSQDEGVGVNLVWTQVGGVHQTLAYRQGGVESGLAVVSGTAALSVVVDVDTQTYALWIGGELVQTGIPFDEAVALDTVRFFTDSLNELFVRGRCFDNLTIESTE
jgi:hypothetical protein